MAGNIIAGLLFLLILWSEITHRIKFRDGWDAEREDNAGTEWDN